MSGEINPAPNAGEPIDPVVAAEDPEAIPADAAESSTSIPTAENDTSEEAGAEDATKQTRQKKELSVLESNILYKRISSVKREFDDLSEQQRKDILNSSPEKNAVWVLGNLESGFNDPIVLDTEDNPLKMTRPDGEEVIIAAFERGVGDIVYCTVINSEKGTEHGIAFNRTRVAKAHLASEKTNITAGMNDDEEAVIDLSIKLSEDEDLELPENIDDIIENGAEAAHMFTKKTLEDFIKGAQLPEDKANELREIAGDGYLLNSGVFKAAVQETDLSPTKLQVQLDETQIEIANLESKEQDLLKEGKKLTFEEKVQLQNLKERVFDIKNLQEKFESGELENIFNNIQTGEEDAETSKGFLEAFRSGKLDEDTFKKIMDLPAFKKKGGETEAEWRARMKKRVGLVGLVALILLMGGLQMVQATSQSQQQH